MTKALLFSVLLVVALGVVFLLPGWVEDREEQQAAAPAEPAEVLPEVPPEPVLSAEELEQLSARLLEAGRGKLASLIAVLRELGAGGPVASANAEGPRPRRGSRICACRSEAQGTNGPAPCDPHL